MCVLIASYKRYLPFKAWQVRGAYLWEKSHPILIVVASSSHLSFTHMLPPVSYLVSDSSWWRVPLQRPMQQVKKYSEVQNQGSHLLHHLYTFNCSPVGWPSKYQHNKNLPNTIKGQKAFTWVFNIVWQIFNFEYAKLYI